MADQIGVITEQGDLGLGCDILNEKEQALAEKVIIKEENGGVSKTQIINEQK